VARELLDRLEKEVTALPDVRSAATSLYLPLEHVGMNLRFGIEGRPSRSSDQFNAPANVVSPGYFRTIGARLVRGRQFGPEDVSTSPRVVIINETVAREYFLGEDPIGKRLTFPYPDLEKLTFTIVGVVNDVVHDRLSAQTSRTIYLSQTQEALSEFLIVRVSSPNGAVVDSIRERIRSVDGTVIVTQVRTLDEIASRTLEAPRLRTSLFSLHSAASLLLAASGLFGLLGRLVTERFREIGIRMALGASRESVLLLVCRSSLAWVLGGLAVGLVAAAIATRYLSSLLYAASPHDPVAYAGTALTLVAAALLACVVPARRAAAIDPAAALRRE
jgi:putative ABC transport system permease protein